MNIKIVSLHFKADQKLEKFIQEKVEKLFKVHEGIIGADVTLKVENFDHNKNKTAEIKLKIKGNDALATKTSGSFEESVDEVIEALKKQLLKIKEKQKDKKSKFQIFGFMRKKKKIEEIEEMEEVDLDID
jgi:ribosomal subunit interface protein